MTQLPPEVYPVAVYSSTQRATPDRIRVQATETSLVLIVDGLMIGVGRDEDDTHLHAAINTAMAISQSAERFGAQLRAELERRARLREAEPVHAAMRAAYAADRGDPLADELAHPVAPVPAFSAVAPGELVPDV